MLNNFCFHVYAQKSLSHSLTLSLSLDMLNKFCFHVYAQKTLFIAENCNAFFFTSSSSAASAPCEFANHRADSKLKNSIITLYVIGNGSELFNDRPLSHAQVSLSTCIEIQPNLLPFIISCIAIH